MKNSNSSPKLQYKRKSHYQKEFDNRNPPKPELKPLKGSGGNINQKKPPKISKKYPKVFGSFFGDDKPVRKK